MGAVLVDADAGAKVLAANALRPEETHDYGLLV